MSCTTGISGEAIAQPAESAPSTTTSQRHSRVRDLERVVASGHGCRGSVTSLEITVGFPPAVHIGRTLSRYPCPARGHLRLERVERFVSFRDKGFGAGKVAVNRLAGKICANIRLFAVHCPKRTK
ncbi:hypothetical protein GCM10023192_02840 [Amycolatopsis samaneae]